MKLPPVVAVNPSGPQARHWKGGKQRTWGGYILVYAPNHPHARSKYVREHRLVAEKAIGHVLPASMVMHHVNDVGDDNRGSNLVVLENQSEHRKLHARRAVLRAGGNPWTDRMCADCGPRPIAEFKPRGHRPSHRSFGLLASLCRKCWLARHRKYDRQRAQRKRRLA
jgi:hypothetical protein